MGLPGDDPAHAHRAGLDRVVRIAHVVLLDLPGAPTRDVQPAVVDGKVDVGDQRRNRAEWLKRRWQLVGLGRLGRNGDRLLDRPVVVVTVPQPYRRGQILDADHHADEAPGLARVVSGPHLEHHLVLVAEIDPLEQPPLGEAPEIEVVAEALAEQILGVQPVLDHRRRGPLGGHRHVLVQVPPEVVGEVLVATVGLPGACDLERVVVDQRHAARPVTVVGRAEVRHEDAARSAVDGVRARVSGLLGELLRLDRAHDLWLPGIGLGVEDVGARRAEARARSGSGARSRRSWPSWQSALEQAFQPK